MRDLFDLNDLYNGQDVILLLEIMENRFQAMYEKSMYNPRKCKSASKLYSTRTARSDFNNFDK